MRLFNYSVFKQFIIRYYNECYLLYIIISSNNCNLRMTFVFMNTVTMCYGKTYSFDWYAIPYDP